MSKFLIDLTHLIVVILAGVITNFSFAPYNYSILSFVSVFLLFNIIEFCSLKKAITLGYLYGLAMYSASSLHIYMLLYNFVYNTFSAIVMYVLLMLFLASYPFFKILIYKTYKGSNFNKIVFFACTWITTDWLRERIFTGYPYVNLGYSLTETAFSSFAPIIGVYGLTWLIVFISGLMYFAFRGFSSNSKLSCCYVGAALFTILLANTLRSIEWTNQNDSSENIFLVQGNAPSKDYWNPQSVNQKIQTYENLTQNNWSNHTIIWPESAITLPVEAAQQYLDFWHTKALANDSSLILGIPKTKPNKDLENLYYNQVLAVGNASGYYYKSKLVPWAEYIPWGTFGLKLAEKLQIPNANMFSDVNNTTELNIINSKYLQWVPFICYEFYFPSYVINRASNGDVLLNLVNDSWFGNTNGLWINLQMAQMRAIETGRPVVRVANNGVTALINHKGKIIDQLPIFTQNTLKTKVTGYTGLTPIMYYGTDFIIFLSCFTMLCLYILSSNKQKSRATSVVYSQN